MVVMNWFLQFELNGSGSEGCMMHANHAMSPLVVFTMLIMMANDECVVFLCDYDG